MFGVSTVYRGQKLASRFLDFVASSRDLPSAILRRDTSKYLKSKVGAYRHEQGTMDLMYHGLMLWIDIVL